MWTMRRIPVVSWHGQGRVWNPFVRTNTIPPVSSMVAMSRPLATTKTPAPNARFDGNGGGGVTGCRAVPPLSSISYALNYSNIQSPSITTLLPTTLPFRAYSGSFHTLARGASVTTGSGPVISRLGGIPVGCFSSALRLSSSCSGLTTLPTATSPWHGMIKKRTFASKKKKNKMKPNAKQKAEAKQKLKAKSSQGKRGSSKMEITEQHEDWLAFQQSIAVEGFENISNAKYKAKQDLEKVEAMKAQPVTMQSKAAAAAAAVVAGISTGGGRKNSKYRSSLATLQANERERQRLTQGGGGIFPPLRYSPEETERLLREAYETIPQRTGPRRSRHKRRQNRRWFDVRRIRKKEKKNRIRAHFRRMANRSRRVRLVKEVLAAAPTIQQRDREYQAKLIQRWMQTVKATKEVEVLQE